MTGRRPASRREGEQGRGVGHVEGETGDKKKTKKKDRTTVLDNGLSGHAHEALESESGLGRRDTHSPILLPPAKRIRRNQPEVTPFDC